MNVTKSSVIRLFSILSLFLAAVLVAFCIGIYSYGREIVGRESIHLHEDSIAWLASDLGQVLRQSEDYGRKVAGNYRLIALTGSAAASGKAIHKAVYDLQADFNSSSTRGRSLMDTYVVTASGTYSAYNSERFLWDDVAADPDYQPVLETGEEVVIPTSYNPAGDGIMQYTFQLAFPMTDYATGELRGIVILDISELMLSLQLNSFLKDNVDLSIVDSDGTILFSRRKKEIGSFYGFTTEELEAVNASASVRGRVKDGCFHLLRRITGTEWYLADKVSEADIFAPLNSLKWVMAATSAVVILLLLGAVVLAGRTIFKRTSRIRDSLREVERGNLSVEMAVARNDEFGEIEAAFNRMTREVSDLIEQVKASERAKRVAETDVLRSQINAHFIHNTLASIRFMLEMDRTAEAGEMVFYFSKLLRQTLDNTAEFVTLREELETLQSYMTLEHFRYANQFEERFEIEDGARMLSVLPLMLQPVVENAIFHAVGKKFIHIVIAAEVRDGVLFVRVRDDGVGISEEKMGKLLSAESGSRHIGLRNVHERLQLYFGQEYGLRIESAEGAGTEVTYVLPAVESGSS